MSFAQPLWLLLLAVLPILHRLRLRSGAASGASMRISGQGASTGPISWRARLRPYLPWFRWVAFALMIAALARPQRSWQEEKVKADALDIMLTMDLSPSMLSKDFSPDRLAVAKEVAIEFVEKRPHDRIGLTAFSAEAFTQCPLTTDRRLVQQYIRDLQIGVLDDGTAIGMGLATAVNRLKDSPSKSKIVILLTDGENNAGYISPEQAADIAKTFNVRVYVIGIGSEGYVPSPQARNPDGSYIYVMRDMTFDTELLRNIAAITQGKFYRAQSEEALKEIYAEIDQLEKTKIEVNVIKRTADYFGMLLAGAVICLLLEMLLRWWLLRSVTL